MPTQPAKLIQRQVQRVRRRLLVVKLLESLGWFWALGFLTCAAWFMLRPFLVSATADWARLGIPACVMIGASVAAVLWSLLRAPRFVTASLALDREFDLQERVTTFTLLSAEQLSSPAGLALVEDVDERLADLDVRSRFPVRPRLSAGLTPILAGVLALAASFFNPSLGGAGNQLDPKQNAVVDAKEIQQQLDNLRQVVKKENDETDLLKSKEMEELEREWEKLVRKPLDPNNKEQVRERTNELAKLEEKIDKRVNDLKDRNADLKKQLDKLSLDKLGKKLQDGPAKDLEDALAKGKFDKAREVLEKLQKDLEANKFSKDEQKKLAEQMKELQDKLKRLTDQKDRKDQLDKDFQDGKISKEQLDRELTDLKKQAAELQDLEDLAEMLGQCKECLGAGNNLKAGQALKGALEKLKTMELSESEMKRLLSDQTMLRSALEGMCEGCNGNCDANGRCNTNGKRNGLGSGKRPGSVRPIGAEPDSKDIDAHEKGVSDPSGQQFITGFSRGGTFKKIPSTEVGGAFQKAVQDAPEAIERQRIPTDAEAQVRGYFQKLGRQRE